MDRISGLGLFVAVVGGVMLLWGLVTRSRANAAISAARSWPTAMGRITATEVLKGGTNGYPTFSPIVRYDYEVGGRTYSGDRLRPGYVKVGSRAAAERMLQPFPVGASVPVRHAPGDAASSVLDLTMSFVPLLTAAIGGGLVLFGLLIAAA